MSSFVPKPFTGLSPGVVVDGRYEILRILGRGGMGAVYEAKQIKLDKHVALKVLRPDRAQEDDGGNSQKRFLREARAASSIENRNVVDIIDFGDLEDGSAYYVMELLKGRDLSSVLKKEGAMTWDRLRPLLRQVLSALAAAHEQGIIHRDIKPANVVMLDELDEWGHEWVKVLDFGIAKVQANDGEMQSLTGTSELLGTVAYMGPELANGERADARTDLYAVGIMAYQLLTGTVPFDAPNAFQVLLRHLKDMPRPPREIDPTISEEAEAFVLRAIAKERRDRFQTAAQMIEGLDAVAGGPDVGTSGPRPAVVRAPIAHADTMVDADLSTRRLTERYQEPTPVEPEHGAARAEPAPEPSPRRPWPLALGAVVAVTLLVLAWTLGVGSAADDDASSDAPELGRAEVVADASQPSEPTEPSGSSTSGEPVTTSTAEPVQGSTGDVGEASAGSTTSGSTEGEGSTGNATESRRASSPRASSSKCRTPECLRKAAQTRLRRSVRRRCRSLGSGEVVKVKLTIGTDGRVLMPRALPPHASTALGTCVVEEVVKGRFPPSSQLTTTQLEFEP